uniref:Uncharacterized protein n=1 Tax=Trichogramma kaykai TaxID=54128 RepID=A0ABD2XQF7_9HYME
MLQREERSSASKRLLATLSFISKMIIMPRMLIKIELFENWTELRGENVTKMRYKDSCVETSGSTSMYSSFS